MRMMKSWASALRAASSISAGLVVGWPYAMLLRTVSLNRIVSCVTCAICRRSEASVSSRTSFPSIRMRPEVTSKKRGIRLTSVDLPAPLGPTSGQHLAGPHLKIHVVQNLLFAVLIRVGKADILELDGVAELTEVHARGVRSTTSSLVSK